VALLVDRWLEERPPAADLAGMLRCVWRGDFRKFRTPLPDECLDLVWVDDGSLWLSGPESRSWAPGNPTGTGVGVRFRPGVGPPLLGLAASDVRDTRVRLDELWRDRETRELAERVALHPDDWSRIRELEDAVRRLVIEARRPVDEVTRALLLGLGGVRSTPVRDIAQSVELSERQLHRRCTAAFGYGPAVLARILRLQRALRLARSHERPRLSDLAVAAGYFDQQHLAHEVRAIMSTTPARLLWAGAD